MEMKLNREKIAQRLKELSSSPPPEDLSPGAKCYAISRPPSHVEFICPTCGEKTLYSAPLGGCLFVGLFSSPKKQKQQPGHRQIKECWHDPIHQIGICDSMVEKLSAIGAKLDKREFCSNCCPEVDSPQLGLTIQLLGEDPRYIFPIDKTDLLLLQEFLNGNKKIPMSFGRERPLVNFQKRIEELLGISLGKVEKE